eukprot:scaffold22564_cov118-Cylindrotheca_fusiformis.AAC.1
MHTRWHDEKRKSRKKRRWRRYLFLAVTTTAAVVLSAVPIFMALKFDLDRSPSIRLESKLESSIVAPCACNFGRCLQWDTENLEAHFPCANLFPLRWYETWDDTAKAWYSQHKRTNHFEVINLVRVDPDTNTTSCDYPEMITYFHIFKNGGTTVRNAFWREQTKLPYAAKILFTGMQSRLGYDRFHERLNRTVT